MSDRPRVSTGQLNSWANRALENLLGGWHALAEHQLRLIIEATGGIDDLPHEERRPASAERGEPTT